MIAVLPWASQKTSPARPQWFCRCRAVKPQRRWCARTGRSPEASARLACTRTHCPHSRSATDRGGSLLLYTAAEKSMALKESHPLNMQAYMNEEEKNLWEPLFPLDSYLHVKQSGAISRPLLDDAHVLEHGLMLRHTLQPRPLLQNAGPCGWCLFLHPHLQHLLLLHLEPHRSAPKDLEQPSKPNSNPASTNLTTLLAFCICYSNQLPLKFSYILKQLLLAALTSARTWRRKRLNCS